MKVFISHSREHQDVAHSLQTELSARGYDVVTAWSMAGSGNINGSIVEQLNDADAVLAIFPSQSPNVLYEAGYTAGGGKPLLIVSLDDGPLPFDLMTSRFVAWRADHKSAISEIADWLTEQEINSSTVEPGTERLRFVTTAYRVAPALFERISADLFEKAIWSLFESLHYDAVVAENYRDNGIDCVLRKFDGHPKTLVQIKKLSKNSPVSVDTIQQLMSALLACKADRGLVVSASGFSPSAREFARRSTIPIELWDMEAVLQQNNRLEKRSDTLLSGAV